jgi:hypothetical protein
MESVEQFAKDMGPTYRPGLTIERVDNNLGYSPDNCVWIPLSDQTSNTRANRRITFGGRTLIASKWAKETGIGLTTLLKRLDIGWPEEKALTHPVRNH